MSLDLHIEREKWKEGKRVLIGIDEVGRGALAGPLVVASVTGVGFFEPIQGIKDSKKLSSKKIMELAQMVSRKHLIGIGLVREREIDIHNILNANMLAMKRSIRGLLVSPDCIFVDGRKIPEEWKSVALTIVRGDTSCYLIAAASICAKFCRDQIMRGFHSIESGYDWINNVGYGTARHLKALFLNGPSLYHRMSFSPVKNFFSKNEK